MVQPVTNNAEHGYATAYSLLKPESEHHFARLRCVMIVYRAKRKSAFKWILAAVIFIGALCITFNDVYGAAALF
jgi:hypothetical protein